MPHIFERCYKGKGGNFGIGLAVAKTAAVSMGGDLKAENHKERGAVFTVGLPECVEIPKNGVAEK